jgi:glycosyltransferase involved in cell wall biosynthesis
MNSNRIGISAVIIALNEERDIESCLRSVDWCDEIIVVDGGSTDGTLKICRDFGCKVFEREFNGFGEQKQYAVDLAENDWVLSIDADEVVSPALQREILSVLNTPQHSINGYYLPITTILWDQKVRHSVRYTRPKLRLFNRDHGRFNLAKLHEGVDVSGEVGTLTQAMYNYAYADINDYFQKFNFYTSVAAKDSHARRKSAAGFSMLLRFPFQFIKMYFFQGFFLDGLTGLLWALCSSFYPLVKSMKLRELNAASRRNSLKSFEVDTAGVRGFVPSVLAGSTGGQPKTE